MAKNKQKRLLIETKKGGTQRAVKSDKVQLVRSLKGHNQQFFFLTECAQRKLRCEEKNIQNQ